MSISSLDIYNRQDCCEDRVDQIKISFDGVEISTLSYAAFKNKNPHRIDVDPPLKGRVLRFEKNSGEMHMAEVVVMGGGPYLEGRF